MALALMLTACGPNEAEKAAAKEAEAQQAAYPAKYAKAKALFEERCMTAGVVIHRTVKDVDGIELLKVRPAIKWGSKAYFDPMFEGAAMAGEAQGEHYIKSFLWAEYRNRYHPQDRGQLNPDPGSPADNELPADRGYRFVEALDPLDGQRRRFELPAGVVRGDGDPGLIRLSPSAIRPRYAIDYEDIVDPDDRALWIAGTRLRVIDQSNGEVVAVLTRYVWDAGFGNPATGRWPWDHADGLGNVCPYYIGTRSHETRFFVDRVLIPKQQD